MSQPHLLNINFPKTREKFKYRCSTRQHE